MTERSPIMKTFDRFHHWTLERAVTQDAAVISAAILTAAWVIADVLPTSFDRERVKKIESDLRDGRIFGDSQ